MKGLLQISVLRARETTQGVKNRADVRTEDRIEADDGNRYFEAHLGKKRHKSIDNVIKIILR